MSRKREKPYPARHLPYSLPKRRRRPPPSTTITVDDHQSSAPAVVVVIGLPAECSVLELKSRFEIYGPISRIRIDPLGLGFITFRSSSAAADAVSAAADPSFGISIHSKRVKVIWASDAKSSGAETEKKEKHSSSKLVRAETPLRRHGRGNKLSSAIVNSRSTNTNNNNNHNSMVIDPPYKGREIVAYDDIL